MRIFISIASYKDAMLVRTIQRAVETANKHYRLNFGIINQDLPNKNFEYLVKDYGGLIRHHLIDPRLSHGACWARALAMSLYKGEEYFLQIDAHTDFDDGWDDFLIEKYHELNIKQNGVISSYPPGFHFVNDRWERMPSNNTMINILNRNQKFKENEMSLGFEPFHCKHDEPVKGFHLAAGFIFTCGEFVKYFPYDPELYFIGEEQSLACRLFTKGWDIHHIAKIPIYHLYNTGNIRPLHWDEADDKKRDQRWWLLEAKSQTRLMNLLYHQNDYGAFGLGKIRSMQEYAKFSGIDYKNKIITY